MTTAEQDSSTPEQVSSTAADSMALLSTSFTVRRRGYCRDQVDSHLRTVCQALAEAEEACRLANRRAQIAEADRASALAELRERGGRIPEPRGAMTPPAIGLAVERERERRAAECRAHQARLRAARETTERLDRAREEAGAEAGHEATAEPGAEAPSG